MTTRQTVSLYLSGSIKKGNADTRSSFWTDADMELISSVLAPYHVLFLNPATRSDDLSDFLSTFGRDLLQVYCSDFVLVDARDRRGIGVGSEMAFAKMQGIPVISVSPLGSHYNRGAFEFLGQQLDEWIHPFVFGLSDSIVDTVQDAARIVLERLTMSENGQSVPTLAAARFLDSIRHYVETQLERDSEMSRLVHSSPRIEERLRAIRTGRELI